jgi:hypothetical protein
VSNDRKRSKKRASKLLIFRNSTSAKDFNNIHNPAFFQDGERELTLLETVRQAAVLRPKAAKIWGHQLTKITSEQIKEIFDRFPDARISTPAKEFALKLIDYNQQEILEELNFPNGT